MLVIQPSAMNSSASRSPRTLGIKWQKEWTACDFVAQSDLSNPSAKILHEPALQADIKLWQALFEFRERTYGAEGIRMYWKAVRDGYLDLPTISPMADVFWTSFLKLGCTDNGLLLEIVRYAKLQMEHGKKAWSKIYVTVLQELLLLPELRNNMGPQYWHNRLMRYHSPTEEDFAELCFQVVSKRGDIQALKEIYRNSKENSEIWKHKGIYSKVIPVLCDQERFPDAYSWHHMFVERGVLPTSYIQVEPLISHYSVYDRTKAAEITKGLREADVSFSPELTLASENLTKIGKQLVGILYGKDFGLKPKEYNDALGARWFATTWVSLDISINAVGALGVEQIGPLSLQAIALREPNSQSIARRLDQLLDIGISTGKSVYSQAIVSFARGGKEDLLQSLLGSDQHPDALEDRKLQEQLLAMYARDSDWPQYQRTLAIRLIGANNRFSIRNNRSEEIENIVLRSLVAVGETSTVLQKLRRMQQSGHSVTPISIRHVLRHILRHRLPGRRPNTQDMSLRANTGEDDLMLAIRILIDTLVSGSFVPITFWREIMKRLGMLDRLDDLRLLTIFLASYYGARVSKRSFVSGIKQGHRYEPPKCVPSHSEMHPLRILFPPVLQGAIVEWGIIRALNIRLGTINPRCEITDGIIILKKLNELGVFIEKRAIADAVLNRLRILYGIAGVSNVRRNRAHIKNNPYSLVQMLTEIHRAYGGPLFDLKMLKEQFLKIAPRIIEKRNAKNLKEARPEERKTIDTMLTSWGPVPLRQNIWDVLESRELFDLFQVGDAKMSHNPVLEEGTESIEADSSTRR